MRPELKIIRKLPTLILAAAVVLLVGGLCNQLLEGGDDRGPSARLTLDAWYYHAYLPSIFLDHDLDLTNEYRKTKNWHKLGIVARTGLPSNVFGVGPALLSAPFYAAGTIAAHDDETDDTGFGPTQVRITLLASPFFTGMALWFIGRLLTRRLGGTWLPIAAGVLALLSGPAFYYAVRQPGYSHPAAALFTCWLLDAWDASYDTPRTLRTWLTLGALFGATALARPQLAFWGVVLVVAAVDDLRRGAGWRAQLRAQLPRWLAGAAMAVLVFAPQLIVWKVIYGRMWLVPQGRNFMVWIAPCWSEVLFSTRNGWWAWAPVHAIGMFGLLLSLKRTPRLSALLLVGVVLQVWANGAVWDWWGGTSFGGRRFDSCVLAVAYGLGFLFTQRLRVVALLAGVIVVVCTYGNMRFALESSAWSLMPPGGRPMREVMAETRPRWLVNAVATVSEAVCLPARALFAWRHGVPLDAYDRVVGPHVLTEAYPQSGGGPRLTHRMPTTGSEPYLIGFTPAPGGARLVGERGKVLVGMNKRHGPIFVAVRMRSQTPVRLWWDGKEIGVVWGFQEARSSLERVERGVHELEIEAPPGTRVAELYFEIDASARP